MSDRKREAALLSSSIILVCEYALFLLYTTFVLIVSLRNGWISSKLERLVGIVTAIAVGGALLSSHVAHTVGVNTSFTSIILILAALALSTTYTICLTVLLRLSGILNDALHNKLGKRFALGAEYKKLIRSTYTVGGLGGIGTLIAWSMGCIDVGFYLCLMYIFAIVILTFASGRIYVRSFRSLDQYMVPADVPNSSYSHLVSNEKGCGDGSYLNNFQHNNGLHADTLQFFLNQKTIVSNFTVRLILSNCIMISAAIPAIYFADSESQLADIISSMLASTGVLYGQMIAVRFLAKRDESKASQSKKICVISSHPPINAQISPQRRDL